jgi:hypothetical protein
MDEFGIFLLVGFFAQLVDGALGMGFGVISSAILLGQGVAPPLVSASVNAAKLPTGFTSMLSHYYHGNIDWRIVRKVAFFGVLGGLCGALLLTSLQGAVLVWLINAYLIGIGLLILIRALRGVAPILVRGDKLGVIGGIGGVIEGIGGAWGPVVTSALLGSGVPPRQAVGSSNTSEFIVSMAVLTKLVVTFALGFWGSENAWQSVLYPVLGLVAGGVPAAFLGGWLARHAPRRVLTFAVAFLVLGIAVYRIGWA